MSCNRLLAICTGFMAVLAMAGTARAQLDQLPAGLLDQLPPGVTADQILQLLDQLGVSGSGGATTQPSTTQPANRIGSPSTMINAAVAEHIAFNRTLTTTTVTPPSEPPPQVRLPITFLIAGLLNILDDFIPGLSDLTAWFNNYLQPSNGGNDTVTPPDGLTGRGPVAFLTADDTTLTVGQTTTVRLWVQQSSPNATEDNGIFSVAVNAVASPAGIIQSSVPVTILSPWDASPVGVEEGTASPAGGISGMAAGLAIDGAKDEGIPDPVQVLNFEIKAVAAGTVTLTPTNFFGGGWEGLSDWNSQTGDESEYVPVEITVTR